jgi:mannose-1-phosphate guanylyltransferase/phosphomannomutase
VGEGAEIHPDAEVVGPAVIGENCRIEEGVRLGPYTVLGTNVRVRANTDLERVVVHDNSYLGEGVRLRGTIVGRSCDLRSGVRAEEGVVLGDECFVGEHAVLGAGVKVYPFKTVEQGAVINSSIVWESRGSRSLFGRVGVAGLANVDITPELATRLAMAYGTSLKKNASIITSRDSSRSARMLKRAMMAGANAAGINVLDLEVASVPVTRFIVRRPANSGGSRPTRPGGNIRSAVVISSGRLHQRMSSIRSCSTSVHAWRTGSPPAQRATKYCSLNRVGAGISMTPSRSQTTGPRIASWKPVSSTISRAAAWA